MTVPSKPSGGGLSDLDLEAAVRQYLGKITRRYTPFIVGLVTLLLIVAIAPTTSPTGTGVAIDDFQPNGQRGPASGPFGTPSTPGSPSTPSTPGATSEPGGQAAGPLATSGGTAATTGSSSAGTSGSRPTTAGSSASGPTTQPGAGAPSSNEGGTGQPGVSRAGVTCTSGARQVPWSEFGTPYCQPKWSGDNGGATSHGVTANTITMTFRNAQSGQGAALQAMAGSASEDISIEAYEHDLRVYIDFFNTQYELYGRKVELVTFDGQGDYLEEYQGQNIPGAQADAQTAYDLGAFGDLSFSQLVTTVPYAQALAANKVMSLGGAPGTQSIYRAMAPYAWNPLATLDLLAAWFGNVTCQRLAGLDASFSTHPPGTPRVFGMVHPDTPYFNEAGDQTEAILNRCGVELERRIRYSPNLSQQSNDATNAMIQLKAAGVTTLLCLCDGTGNIFLTSAASSQAYYPEWVQNGIADEDAQRMAWDQAIHMISPNGAAYGEELNEALQVYRLADPSMGHELPETILSWVYLSAIMTFNGIQNAGPNLTPQNFQQGMWTLPASLPILEWKPDTWDGARALPVLWFDRNSTSQSNGQAGAFRLCTGADGAFRNAYDQSAFGPKGTQLNCFES